MAHANSRRQRFLTSRYMPRARRYWLDTSHRAERREGREIARLLAAGDEARADRVKPARVAGDPWRWD